MDELNDFDWSEHRKPIADLHRGRGLHLVEATAILGKKLYDAWDESLFWRIQTPPSSANIPAPESAFRDGNPISAVHAEWHATIRGILPVGHYQSAALRECDEPEWLATHRRHPETSRPIPAGELRTLLGEDADDPITEAHWEQAFTESVLFRVMHDWDVIGLKGICMALVDMLEAGSIVMTACASQGTARQVFASDWWGPPERRLAMLASCSIVDADLNPTDERLFVDRTGFEEAVDERARDHPIEFGAPEPEAEQPDEAAEALRLRMIECTTKLEGELAIREFCANVLLKEERRDWTTKDLQHIVERHPRLGDIKYRDMIVEKIAADWGKDLFPFLKKAGRPRNTPTRPSKMADWEVDRLIEDSDAS